MRKLLCIFLLTALLLSTLAACNASDKTPDGTPDAAPDNVGNDTSADTTAAQELYFPETWYLECERVADEQLYEMYFSRCEQWMQEFEGFYIQTPVKYTETVDGCEITIDFFQEYYKIGEPLQVRVTVTNNTNADIEYNDNTDACCIWSLHPDDGKLSICPINEDQSTYLLQFVRAKTLKAGESVTFERLFVLDPNRLTYGHKCQFKFYCIRDVNVHLEYIRK